MAAVEFDRATRDSLGRLLKTRLKTVLGVDADPVDCLQLLDVLSEALGPHYYNQGLYDAQAAVQSRIDSILEAIGGIEKPTRLY